MPAAEREAMLRQFRTDGAQCIQARWPLLEAALNERERADLARQGELTRIDLASAGFIEGERRWPSARRSRRRTG
jgi:hypothetical protein